MTAIRNASGDVDAVFLVEGKAIREIADQVAARLGLPRDWINEGVKRMAPPPGDPQPNLILAGEYPFWEFAEVGGLMSYGPDEVVE